MKVKVFSAVEIVEKEICLQLRQSGSHVELIVVNPQTGGTIDCGIIAYIAEDGRLHLCSSANPNIGLELDKNGRIKLD